MKREKWMHQKLENQNGRSMIEMLTVLMLIGVLSVGSYQLFRVVANRVSMRNLEKDMDARVVQVRHKALTPGGIRAELEAQGEEFAQSYGSASGIPVWVVNHSAENAQFTLRIGSNSKPLKSDLCQILLKDLQQNNKVTCFVAGGCPENSKTGDFVFKDFCKGTN